jgi:hypothetical protein
MPFELELPSSLRKQRWKVKIRERERVEPPHVTIIRNALAWRFDLRDLVFLDKDPPPRDVSRAVVDRVVANIDELRAAWDRMYPENPVGGDR